MSTTVIASGQNLLFPLLKPHLNQAELTRVLQRHGLTVLPDGLQGTEFIAAQGLDHHQAAQLAQDLQALGLHVRVVNKTGITQSARIGNAIALHMIGAVLLLTIAFCLVTMPGAWPLTMVAAVLASVGLLGALTLGMRGGVRLQVATDRLAGAPDGASEVMACIAELRQSLPEHIVAPMEARARALQQQARLQPGGAASKELRTLASELRDLADEHVADEARSLRDDLLRARQALRETQGLPR